jgi:1,4-alpha-glucan branching enzyme
MSVLASSVLNLQKFSLPFRRAYLLLVLIALAQSARTADDFSKQHARSSPAWLRDAVVYEIFPRNFSAEGNFNRITARLEDLEQLGANIVWLMPIHPIGEQMRKGHFGSPYAIRDYCAINPDYGTEEDLKRLVAGAHQRDMKVIIDVVANHTAWDSVMMKTPEFYKQDPSGKIMPPATI